MSASAEVAQLAAADVEDAEQRLGLQRNAGRAAHVAAQHLADDLDLREVVEHDRLGALGDASREPAADGHAQRRRLRVERGSAALDELAARLVEQQDAHGVALEQRGDAPGDLGEQLVDRQARQREVADLLQPREPGRERLLGLEGLGAAQRLRAEARDDLEELPFGVGKVARLGEDEGERADRPAVDEQRERREGLEPAGLLEAGELRVPGSELVAVVDEDRLARS